MTTSDIHMHINSQDEQPMELHRYSFLKKKKKILAAKLHTFHSKEKNKGLRIPGYDTYMFITFQHLAFLFLLFIFSFGGVLFRICPTFNTTIAIILFIFTVMNTGVITCRNQ